MKCLSVMHGLRLYKRMYKCVFFSFIQNGIILERDKNSILFKMPQQCMGIKTDGNQCPRESNEFIHLDATHLHYCHTHWEVYRRRVEVRRALTTDTNEHHHHRGTCHKWLTTRRWCGVNCQEGSNYCQNHLRRDTLRIERENAARRALEIDLEHVRIILREYRLLTWRQVIDELFIRRDEIENGIAYRVAIGAFRRPPRVDNPELEFREPWQFTAYWRWSVTGRVGNPPDLAHQPGVLPIPQRIVTAPTLAQIVADRQNVHTRVVSQQTNKGLEKLLKESGESSLHRSPEWFASKWLSRSYGNWNPVSKIVTDMRQWYETRTCRLRDDYLYMRTLDGLYLTIRKLDSNRETQNEMYKRVFEECQDSVGMCCDGHISRLCNVLVGFDDTFEPPVPFGEILQNKMAAIYALDIEPSEKIKQATEFFNEFAVPEEDRVAWIEAF